MGLGVGWWLGFVSEFGFWLVCDVLGLGGCLTLWILRVRLVWIWCFSALGVGLVAGFGSGVAFAAGYGVLCLGICVCGCWYSVS